jgi:hypothetical protein
MLNGGTLNYFAVPWGIINNPLPLFAVAAVEAGLMGAVEVYRRNGTGPAGYSPGVGKFESNSECHLARTTPCLLHHLVLCCGVGSLVRQAGTAGTLLHQGWMCWLGWPCKQPALGAAVGMTSIV